MTLQTMKGRTQSRRERRSLVRATALLTTALLLAGCEDFEFPTLGGADAEETDTSGSVTLVERDVEAPDVFQVTEAGLWDGRPSLGGVWVAHPDTGEPERVIIRNNANGRFVIGSLFRRERDAVGPRLQVSSDAAQALGLLAGAPVELNVTALRRQTVEEVTPDATAEALPEPDEIETAALDPIAGAAAAIEAAPDASASPAPLGAPADTSTAMAPPPVAEAPSTPARAAPPATTALEKPFIQIGIFSVEANARRTGDMFRSEGVVPQILQGTSQGKTFWRVIIGPATSTSERAALLELARGQGFSDAYFVTN